MPEQLGEVPNIVSLNSIQPWTAEHIVDMPVPKVVEEHVEITKVSSQNRVQQRSEEQSVVRERISECEVEQVVDVSAGQMAEVLLYHVDTIESVEFRKKFFSGCTPTGTLFP